MMKEVGVTMTDLLLFVRENAEERERRTSRDMHEHARKSVQARSEILMEYKPIDRDFTRAAD
jgi:hypothetical protein